MKIIPAKLQRGVRRGLSCALFPAVLIGSFSHRAAAAEQLNAAGRFQMNCALCHGTTGRPDPTSPVVRALQIEPADLADPLFNSREPGEDWFLVVKHGGAALGLSERMPSFQGVLNDEEIRALIGYVKTLPGDHDYPPGELNLFLPLRTKKAFPEDEVVWKVRRTDHDGTEEWKNTLEIEKRFATRFQAVLELSHRFDDGKESFDSVEAGGKYVMYHSLERGFIASAAGILALNLDGSRAVEALPYLAVGKIFGEHLTFQGSARARLPFDGVTRGRAELSGIIHWTHTPWPRSVFPGLEFTAEVPFKRGAGPAAGPAIQGSVTPQVRVGLTRGGHVAMNLGVEVPINARYRFDHRAHLYLIWDFADGSLWKGW